MLVHIIQVCAQECVARKENALPIDERSDKGAAAHMYFKHFSPSLQYDQLAT